MTDYESKSVRPLEQRHASEESFHDAKSQCTRQDTFYTHGATLPGFHKFLALAGPLQGLQVLDLGCGTGWASIYYAQNGATVTAMDISEGALKIAKEQALVHGLHIHFVKGSAEEMEYREAFDRILGISILHHTDLHTTASRIYSALKPGGIAVFMEPLAHNPILNLFRKLTPGRRSPDERPLKITEIHSLSTVFDAVEIYGYGLLTLFAFLFAALRAYNAFRTANRLLSSAETELFRRLPSLQKFCWGAVLRLGKKTSDSQRNCSPPNH